MNTLILFYRKLGIPPGAIIALVVLLLLLIFDLAWMISLILEGLVN